MLPRAASVALLICAGCSLDRTGLGAPDARAHDAGTDAGRDAAVDAATPDAFAPRDATTGADATVPEDAPPPIDVGPADACRPTAETCNGLDDDCDGLTDSDDVDACGGSGSRCLLQDGTPTCMYMACPGDPCCDVVMSPCSAGFSCEHVSFAATDCPPECAGQCDNCHMCVMR